MKTKIIKIVFAFYCLLFAAQSYSQTWQWANSAGGINQDQGSSICRDNNGNIYITGEIRFPTVYFNTDTLSINGFSDFFLAKYDVNGNEIWVKKFGGYNPTGSGDGIPNVFFDTNTNSIYMSGGFYNNCTFGSFILNAASSTDIQAYIAKFDLNGNCIWAKSAGGGGDDGFNTPIKLNDFILASGYFQYEGMIDTISLPAGGFIAKYNDNGKCVWAKHIITGGSPQSIKVFNSDIFISGIITDSVALIGMMQVHAQYQTVYYNQFLARFDSIGHVKWVKLIGYPNNTQAISFSMDNNGNSYNTGSFLDGYAVFDNDTIHTNTNDFFIAKYDQFGNFKWVQQSNASLGAYGGIVTTDNIGNTYMTGSFSGNANFGSYNTTSSTSSDMFIVRYDSSGSCIGVRNVGQALGGTITSDENSNAYITGCFLNTANFGSSALVSHGNIDIFIAKLNAITGISHLDKAVSNNLIIYANPTTGKCNITVPDEFLNETNLTLSIFDNSGKIIQQKKLEMSENKIKLDLEAEAKGIYTAVLSNGKKSYTGKIVFE